MGSELDLYDVQTTYPHVSVDTYIPFLGELQDGFYFQPSDSAKEMMDKVADMVSVCWKFPYVILTNWSRKKYLLVYKYSVKVALLFTLGHQLLSWQV